MASLCQTYDQGRYLSQFVNVHSRLANSQGAPSVHKILWCIYEAYERSYGVHNLRVLQPAHKVWEQTCEHFLFVNTMNDSSRRQRIYCHRLGFFNEYDDRDMRKRIRVDHEGLMYVIDLIRQSSQVQMSVIHYHTHTHTHTHTSWGRCLLQYKTEQHN